MDANPVQGAAMASIETQRRENGRKAYRVRWREGGRRSDPWDGETFDSYDEARRFQALVTANRNRRPSDQQLVQNGFEYLIPEETEGLPGTASQSMQGGVVTLRGGESDGRMPTFSKFAEEYIDDLDNVQGYTKRRYRSLLKNHVTPYFGERPINLIDEADLKVWQRKLTAKGLGRKSIQNVRGSVVAPVFKEACKPRRNRPAYCTYNPLEELKLPFGRTKKRDVITTEADLRLYAACAYEVDPEAADLLMVALATAMRWGDLAGMRKRDFIADASEIRPGQVYARGSEKHDRWELRPYTKSIAGDERVIPLPPGIVELLRRRVEHLEPDDLVFTAPQGGPWDHGKFRERRYLPILRLAQSRGLAQHVTPQVLRHSALTMLADEGGVACAVVGRCAGVGSAGG
jgi:integrase